MLDQQSPELVDLPSPEHPLGHCQVFGSGAILENMVHRFVSAVMHQALAFSRHCAEHR